MDELGVLLGNCLLKLLQDGFKPPLHFAVIGVNGAVVAGTFRDNDQGGLTAEFKNFPEETLIAPLNVMFTDARGEAARVVLGPDEEGLKPKWIQ